MGQYLLQADNISMQFDERLLFYIPRLTLGVQDSVYLTGANGVGKTTLLKLLAGLQSASSGRVEYNDKIINSGLFPHRRHHGIIYLHQTPYMFDGSVLANISYGLNFIIKDRQKRRAEAINALRLVGLESLADEHISVLSGGERQCVAMARAWVLHPRILLMDEASASLDQTSIGRLLALAQQLLARGTSLVITSHQENALTALCQRQWRISNNSLIEKSSLQSVTGSEGEDNFAL